MVTTVAVDGSNDLYLGANGNLATATGLPAVLQSAQQAAQTILGEMIYSTQDGMPNFEAVWAGNPNPAVFEAYLRKTLLAVEGVVSVQNIATVLQNNKLQYQVTIITEFGAGVLGG